MTITEAEIKSKRYRPDIAEIVQAIRNGEKYQWIGEHFKVNQMTICRYRDRFNLPRRNKRTGKPIVNNS